MWFAMAFGKAAVRFLKLSAITIPAIPGDPARASITTISITTTPTRQVRGRSERCISREKVQRASGAPCPSNDSNELL
jgi:hypothetical protein